MLIIFNLLIFLGILTRNDCATHVNMLVTQTDVHMPSASISIGRDGMKAMCSSMPAKMFDCVIYWRNGVSGVSLSNNTLAELAATFKTTAVSLRFVGATSLQFDVMLDSHYVRYVAQMTARDHRFTNYTPLGDLVEQAAGRPYRTQMNPPVPLAFLSYYANKCGGTCQPINEYRFSKTGKNVTVYIVDQEVRADHEEFKGADGRSRVSEDRFYSASAFANKGIECASWHGTHVAAIVAGTTYGVAKEATIVSVAVQPGCNMGGFSSDLASGLDWVIERHLDKGGPAIVSMSLLITNPGSGFVISDQIDQLLRAGVVVVAASGNLGKDACDYAPANIDGVLSVAAIQVSKSKTNTTFHTAQWSGSNYGKCVSVWAPGVMIESASSEMNNATSVLTGTSQAAPFITGIVALLLEGSPNSTNADIKNIISTGSLKDKLDNASLLGTINEIAQTHIFPSYPIIPSPPAPTPPTSKLPTPPAPKPSSPPAPLSCANISHHD
jgi:subtilisin family serine protease